MSRRLGVWALHAALLCGAVFALVPFLWMVSASLMPAGEANGFPPRWIPSSPTLEHYVALFERLDLGRNLANSLLIASLATACSLAVNSMAGYAFAKLRFPGRSRLFGGLLAILVIPSQVAMLPLFLLLRQLGLVNTYAGALVPFLAGVFGIFLVRQYALSIPDELLDAARVDGASEWAIYRRVVLPLCRPVLVTLGMFTFMGAWSDFMWPLVVLTDDAKYTLPVALANLVGEHAHDTELVMAGAVLTILPVVVLFIAMQRHYIEGITLGGVKE